MKQLLFFFLAFIAFNISHASDDQVYGAKPRLEEKALTLSDALAESNLDKFIKVQAKVAKVCMNKGCWMTLTDGKNEVRVTFKDYGFFVPKEILEKEAIVEGKISSYTMSAEEAEHFAKDEGKSAEGSAPKKEYRMVAESVSLSKEKSCH